MTAKTNIRVLLWAPFGAGDHYWGPGTSAFRLYINKDKYDGLEIDLLHSSKKQNIFSKLYSNQFYIEGLEGRNFLSKIKFILKSLSWISKNHKNYDVVHGLSAYYYTFFPLIFFSMLKVKTVIKITGSNSGLINQSFFSNLLGLTFIRKKTLNKISAFICISDEIEKNILLNNVSVNKIFRLPNGVDINKFNKVYNKKIIRETLNLKNVFTLLFVGGLTENKRIHETTIAVKELIDEGYNIQFLIVGPDRSGGAIENKIKKIICNYDSIKLIPHTNKPELYYQLANAFILASKKEGMSNALLEAMSSSLSVLCTNISGSSDLIQDGFNGFFIKSGSVFDIKKSIIYIYENKHISEKFGVNARKTIVRNYSSDRIYKKHIELFNKLTVNGN